MQIDDTAQYAQLEDVNFDIDDATYRDDILRLMFCCCHPDLHAQDQMALALKVICGLPVASIARALLCHEKTMEKRITRAKQKALSTDQQGFELPQNNAQKSRIKAVCSLIYLLFNEGYTNTGGEQHISLPLCSEAIRLCRLLLQLFPTDLEVMGLLALCLFNHSRRNARLDDKGELVPLEKQNRTLWQQELIEQGRLYRDKTLRKNQLGPYQIQAAIAAEHCLASTPEETRWDTILKLYDKLFVLQPTPIVVLNRAVAVAKAIGVPQGLEELKQISARLQHYLYYHTTLAGLLLENNELDGAKSAFTTALEFNPTTQEKNYILQKIEEMNLIKK